MIIMTPNPHQFFLCYVFATTEGQQFDGANNTKLTVKPEKMVDNVSRQSTSFHSPHPPQLEGQFSQTYVIYATPTSPETTFHTVDNPVYGEGSGNSSIDNGENARYIQNPVYGDPLDGSTQQGEVYSTPQLPHVPPLGAGEKSLDYDYAKMDASTNGGTVMKETSTSTEVQAAHEYAVVDKSKKRKNQPIKQSLVPHLDPSRGPYVRTPRPKQRSLCSDTMHSCLLYTSDAADE